MIPTVGRIVHFHLDEQEVIAAIITRVVAKHGRGDMTNERNYDVWLAVLYPDTDPDTVGGGSVRFGGPVPYDSAPGCWSWPPRVP